MTDLLAVLPEFCTQPFSNLLPSLERAQITVADVLTSDAVDIAKRAQLPLREIRRLTDALLNALHTQLGVAQPVVQNDDDVVIRAQDGQAEAKPKTLRTLGSNLEDSWNVISTLDHRLDSALGGGIPTGYVTEVTGESGVGKTQFLLILLLSVQLPSPIGLSKSALYISTEAALSTQRLAQMLSSHPQLQDLHDPDKPSLSRILSIQTPDLESQEHILRFQVPVAIERHNVGLLIIDSITANFRAEFDPSAAKTGTGNSNSKSGNPVGAALMQRTAQLQSLGTLLRDLARKYNLAVVVSNQVADRFLPEPNTSTPFLGPGSGTPGAQRHPPSSHPAASHGNQPQTPLRPKSPLPPSASAPNPSSYPFPDTPAHVQTQTQVPDYPLTLEHQHRFFTGWGDSSPYPSSLTNSNSITIGTRHNLKTPSLGLIWTNQIACRIALVKRKARPGAGALTSLSLRPGGMHDYQLLNATSEAGLGAGASRWQRHFRVVFCAWAGGVDGRRGVEVEIGREGVRSLGGEGEGEDG